MNYALLIVHYSLCIVVHYELCIMNCALLIVHYELCIMHYLKLQVFFALGLGRVVDSVVQPSRLLALLGLAHDEVAQRRSLRTMPT